MAASNPFFTSCLVNRLAAASFLLAVVSLITFFSASNLITRSEISLTTTTSAFSSIFVILISHRILLKSLVEPIFWARIKSCMSKDFCRLHDPSQALTISFDKEFISSVDSLLREVDIIVFLPGVARSMKLNSYMLDGAIFSFLSFPFRFCVFLPSSPLLLLLVLKYFGSSSNASAMPPFVASLSFFALALPPISPSESESCESQS
mmetsp:Transcript_29333/g.44759  ORF Transcript_29333/g.44759 Transcript_29333/m.44759 type:complete len:206 (-) Transcript_29333:458-1075(-)